LAESVEARQAGLVIDYYDAIRARIEMQKAGGLTPLPAESQKAADQSYLDAAARIAEGLRRVLESEVNTASKAAPIWRETAL
jgi:hypothetical protein